MPALVLLILCLEFACKQSRQHTREYAGTLPLKVRVHRIDHILVLAEGARRDQSPARCAEHKKDLSADKGAASGLRCLGARVLVGPADGLSNDAVVASDHCAVVAHFALL